MSKSKAKSVVIRPNRFRAEMAKAARAKANPRKPQRRRA